MWIAIGVGLVVAVGGAIIMMIGNNYNLGVMLVLGGLVIAVMTGVMRMVTAFMDERARQNAK